MRKCDSCGKLYQESKDVFCPHCGAVAQKQCIHGSSFDSKRYDRGEIYKNNNTQYENTTYNQGYEPHAQRENSPYKPQNNEDYGNKFPQINLPDFKKVVSKGKNADSKKIGTIIFVCVIVFNALFVVIGANEVVTDNGLWEDESVVFEENVNELYTVVDKATIKVTETDGEFTSFTLEISGMGFDDYLTENGQNDIVAEDMADKILSEDTFVEMMICDFSNEIVAEESYDNAVRECYYYSGEQIDGKCKYEFLYDFEYDEIVHIVSGVSIFLADGRYINAELPFSAFSVSEDGEIIYYTSYADEQTAWNTVFSECSNEQSIDRAFVIDLDSGE